MPNKTFIAPLGAEAQIVTTAIDLLAIMTPPVCFTTVKILHSCSEDQVLVESIHRINAEIENYRKKSFETEFIVKPFSHKEKFLFNLDTPQEIEILFHSIYSEVRESKQNGETVHILCSGGRKVSAIYCMIAAQMLFEETDKLWYLVSSGEYLQRKKMHPETPQDISQTKLLSIPFISWSDVSPILTEVGASEDPMDTFARIKDARIIRKYQEARIFVERVCTPAERRVVENLAKSGTSNSIIGEKLHLSEKTVETQLRSAFLKAAAYWGIDSVNRTQLATLTQIYYLSNFRENTDDNQ